MAVAKKLAGLRHQRAGGRSASPDQGDHGGKGVDGALDCTAGAGTIPIYSALKH